MVNRKHKILTEESKKVFAKIGSQDGKGKDALVIVKFFSPYNGWRWYATEYIPEDKTFFGYVCGFEQEWGYFSLQEIEETELNRLHAIERDLSFDKKPLIEALQSDGYKY